MKSSPSVRPIAGLVLVASGLLGSATAAEATDVPRSEPADDLASRTLDLDASDLAGLRLGATARSSHGSEVASVARSLRLAGVRVADRDLVVHELEEGVLSVSTPNAEPTKIFIGYGTDDLPLLMEMNSAIDEGVSPGVAVPTGPGSANWAQVNSGTQTIIWSGRGEALNFWYVDKVNNDGTSTRDYWGLRRKVAVQPYDVSGVDWSITGIFAGSYPTSSSSTNIITGWEDMDPSNDLTGGSCQQITQAVDTPVGGLGISFTNCDTHDMSFSATTPGWYTMFYKQGAIFSRGNRSTGYAIAVRTKNGSAQPGWNLETRLEFARYTYPAQKCTKWGVSGTVYC